uniref:uncharacterized protein LOC122594514 isoform X2 n=1 Tax=Erigeron canadensis TaxID=72917 RepID=UPI001CB92206|nr:uncharacterized protein LOC122594514 isoform X2 [Erigeron canadensis]
MMLHSGGDSSMTQQGSLGISLSNDNCSSIRGDTARADGSNMSRQVPVKVFADNGSGDIAIYGGGGCNNMTQQRSHSIALSNSDSSKRVDAGEAGGSNISRQVPVEVFADNSGGDQVPVPGLDQESIIGSSEKFIGGVEGAGFWVRQWWEKCWLFLALWKTI